MSNRNTYSSTTTVDSARTPGSRRDQATEAPFESQGFIRRYRLPLTLAVVAFCLYVGSILYILLGRGQI